MTVRELINKIVFKGLKVAVSWTFDLGVELETLKKYSEQYAWLLDSEVRYVSKTSRYDVVIHI